MRPAARTRWTAGLAGVAAVALAVGPGPASAAWRTIEAETLRPAPGAQQATWSMRLTGGSAGATLRTRRADSIAVRIRGRACGGTRPRARVLVDGRPVLTRSIAGRAWRRHERRARIAPGLHQVGVEIVNPGRRGACRRSVTVDWLAIRERIPIGAAVSVRHFKNDPSYRDALLANFDSATSENDMKFDALEPIPGVYAFEAADELMEIARDAKLKVHGHALVFDKHLPKWVYERRKWAPGEVREMLRSYIHTVVGRYRGRIGSWDVVNEPLAANGSLAPTFFARHLGPDYVEFALRVAHEVDPGAKLYINEVAAEDLSRMSDGLYEMARRLLAKGVPLHGIGFQFHSNIGIGAPKLWAVRVNMQRFAALGLELAVSEMDVRTSTASGPLEARLGEQADIFEGVAALCAEQPACVRMTTWGVTDRFSWLGAHEHPLPFDWAGRAKPSWAAITGALR